YIRPPMPPSEPDRDEPPAARRSAPTTIAPPQKSARPDPVRRPRPPAQPAAIAEDSVTVNADSQTALAVESMPVPAPAPAVLAPTPSALTPTVPEVVTPPAAAAASVTAADSLSPARPPAGVSPPVPHPVDPGPEIRSVIADYAVAIESKSLPRLQQVYPAMTGPQQKGWEQFFQLVRDVKARLSVARLDTARGRADAQVTGTYTYLNTSTGRSESQPVSFRALFENQGGRWRLTQVR
ncbi:MAG TPA: hypothetical protein VJ808_00570, partial [Gemmatimonadales bacterium]|nr:hypothetical protein [Gemmatimonadales bacterium]